MQFIDAYFASMDLDVLEIFREVMGKGSFAEVAKSRNVAPSSISRAIVSLEAELGIKLFQRTTRKVSATEAGQAYYQKISPLLDDLKEASEHAQDIEQSPQGKLKITSSVAFGHHMIVPILDEFMHAYPEIELDFVLTDRTVDIIGEKIDVAIRHGALNDSSMIASMLLKSQYRLVASPDYLAKHTPILRLENIADHGLLAFDIPQFRSAWVFQKKGAQPKKIPVMPRYTISNALSLRALTLQGAGISLLADWLVDEDIYAGRLKQLFPDYAVAAGNYDASIHLVMPSRSYVPK